MIKFSCIPQGFFIFNIMQFYIIISLIDGIIAATFGLFVYWRNRKNIVNKTFGLMNGAIAIWCFSYFIWLLQATAPAALFWSRILNLGATLIPVSYLHWILSLLRLEIKEKKRILTIGYLLTGIFILFSFSPWYIKEVKQVLFFPYWPQAGILYICFLIFGYIGLVTCALYKVSIFYKRSCGVKRAQIKYIILASIIGFAGGATNFPLMFNREWFSPFGMVLFALYPPILTYAILKYRLMDIRVALGRVFIYLATFSSVFALDSLIFLLGVRYFGPLSTNSRNFYSTLLPVIIFSFLFFRLFFKIFSKIASRYFYYSFSSVKEILTTLGRETTSVLEIKKLAEIVTKTLFESFKLNRAVVLIKNPQTGFFQIEKNIGFHEENGISLVKDNFLTQWLEKNNQPLVAQELSLMIENARSKKEKEKLIKLKNDMEKIEAELCLPLVFEKKLIGMIVLGARSLNEAYTKEDIDLLTILADQLSITFENAYLYSKLKDLSENLQEKVDQQTKRLKELLKTKDEFLHIVSHQLRTPLTVLRGYLHLWKSEKFEELPLEKRKRIREYIIDSAERLHNIIKDVLQVVDLEGGRITVKYELVDLKKLVKRVYEIVKPIYQEKGISFKIESSLKKKFVKTDPRFLEIALENILDNAAKYTPKKGKVKVNLLSQKDRFIIKVKDNGIGFSDEDKKILFEKFARGKRAWTLNPNGSGLGLYIVKKVIENLDGEIKIESQGANKGTEIEIILPLL